MPCYDGRENERQVNVTYEHEGRLRKEWMHNSPIAELLCYVMRNLNHAQSVDLRAGNSKLGHWWNDHQVRDAKLATEKVNAEKARKARINREIKRLQDSL